VYDYQTNSADLVPIKTHGGSTSFGNPTIQNVKLNGITTLVVTMFIRPDAAATGPQGFEGGELIYFQPTPWRGPDAPLTRDSIGCNGHCAICRDNGTFCDALHTSPTGPHCES